MSRAEGIDSSHWQGTWIPEEVKAAGKSFVFIKASEADGWTDDQFAVHWLAAKDEGLLRGAYHFWRRQVGAVAQAAHFYETVLATGDLGDLPPVLDLEDTAARKKSGIDIDILQCLHEIERLFGKKPIIYCVAPGTRILTKDLRWVPAEDLRVGDEIIGFDDKSKQERHGRNWRHATITATGIKQLPTYDIYLSSGKVLRATGEHRWLVRLKNGRDGGIVWERTDKLQERLDHHRRRHPIILPKFAEIHELSQTYEGGFLSAAFDGEGCISKNTNNQYRLSFVQKPNGMHDMVSDLLHLEGFDFAYAQHQSGCIETYLKGGKHEVLKFLMKYRPPRLLNKLWQSWDINKMDLATVSEEEIVRVEYAGVQDVVTLSSSSKTYIAEGFGAHNTGAWWMNDWVGRSAFGHYDLWVANYKTVYPWSKPYLPYDWTEWKFWQHSEKGSVPGVQSSCDLNLFYEDEIALFEYAGLGPQKISIELDIETAHNLKDALMRAGV